MYIIKPSVTHLGAEFQRAGAAWVCRKQSLAWNIKYVSMWPNPRLNKESKDLIAHFPLAQVVGRRQHTICDVWGAKEDAGSLAARTATPRACCTLGHISFTVQSQRHIIFFIIMGPRTPYSFLPPPHTHTHTCTVGQKSHFRKVQLVTTAIKVQANWKRHRGWSRHGDGKHHLQAN